MTIEDFDIQFCENRLNLLGFLINKSMDTDLAKNICQDTYIKARSAIERGKYDASKGRFMGWLMYISRNLLVDFWRRENRRNIFINIGDLDIFNHLHEDENFEDKICRNEAATRAGKLIENLSPPQKEVFKMHVVQGMMFKEIAEEKKESVNTILGRMRYARRHLKKAI